MRRALASGRPPRASGMILFFVTQSWKLRVCSNAPPREAFDVMVLDAPRFRDGLLSASCRGIKVSENGIDRRRCGAAKPRPRRAKPRRRRKHCHSTALLAAGNSAAAGRGSSCVLFDPVGANDGHHGSCSSVLPRRNALYDAPRVIIKHCSRTASNVLPRRAPKGDVN